MSVTALTISAIGNFTIAILSLLKTHKNLMLRGFSLLTFCIFSWNMLSLGMFYINDLQNLTLWTKIFRMGLFFLPANFLYFSLLFSQSYRKKYFKLIILNYLISTILSVWTFFIDLEFMYKVNRYYPQPNIIYDIFILHLFINIFFGLIKVLKKYQTTLRPTRKNQLKYFFLAVSIALFGASTNILQAFGLEVPALTSLSTLFYSVIMWYAILRHNLMSLELVLKRSLVYAVLIGMVLGLYLSIVFTFSTYLNPDLNVLVTSLAVIFSAIFFHPLEKYLQKITDKLFFKEKYNYYQTINKLSSAMIEQLDLDKLCQLITKTIYNEMKLKNTAIYLKTESDYLLKSKFNNKKSLKKIDNHTLIQYLQNNKTILSRENLQINNKKIPATIKNQNKQLLSAMKLLDSSLIIPLSENNNLIGFITIGAKLSGDIFSAEDIQLLDSLSHQAVIGLQNARLYKISQDKVNQLTTVSNVTKMISSNLDLEHLLFQITNIVTQVVGADRGILFLYDAQSKELYAVSGAGTEQQELADIRLKVDNSVLGEIFQKGEARLVPHTTRNTEYVHRLGVTSYIVVPMKAKDDQIIGLLTVDNKTSKNPIEQINIELLQTLANQTSIAIENARLYEEATRRVEELSLLNKKVINLKNYYEDILESQPSGVITIDDNNIIKTFNSTASKIINLTINEVLGKSVIDIFANNLEMFSALTTPVQNKEIIYLDQQGQKHTLNINTTKLISRDNKQYGMQSVLVDLTEVKFLEAQIRKNDKLSALGTMVAGVAHEIKNPLTSMKLFIQLMEENKNNPDFWEEYGNIISNEVSRLEKIVEDFLGFARTPELNLEETDINIVINKVINLVKSQARKENVRLNIELSENLPKIKIDCQRMVQVFLNLVLNAIQAIPSNHKGEVSIISKQLSNNEIAVLIKDNGCGIAEKNLEKLFTPFFTTKEKGTGLGLSIINKIVEEHLGEIKVESIINKGTTFTVVLPTCSE